MTNKTAHDVTDEERMLARKWAAYIESNTDYRGDSSKDPWGDRVRAAAHVILHAVPAPPRPTLADMTVEERRACRWMQADTETWGRAVILLPNEGGGRAVTLDQWGHVAYEVRDRVTPRPDLPRMEWPGTGQDGEEATKVDYVPVAGGRTAYGPWTVARLRKKPDTADAVPESTLAVGSVWDDGDSLTRACEETGRDQIAVTDCEGDVYVWDARRDDWRDLHPIQKYAPFTIIYAGKKADQ